MMRLVGFGCGGCLTFSVKPHRPVLKPDSIYLFSAFQNLTGPVAVFLRGERCIFKLDLIGGAKNQDAG